MWRRVHETAEKIAGFEKGKLDGLVALIDRISRQVELLNFTTFPEHAHTGPRRLSRELTFYKL